MTTATDQTLAELDAFERGFVLGLLAGGRDSRPDVADMLVGAARDRCAAALAAIAAEPRGARVRLMGALARDAVAPVPAGIENVHPDTLRGLLERESDDTIRIVATDAPATLQAAAATVLASRTGRPGGGQASPSATPTSDTTAELQRAVLSSIVPVPAPPPGVVPQRWELRLLALMPDAIRDQLARTGADLLGASLAGSDDVIVRRAAAHLDAPWSERVFVAARASKMLDDATGETGAARRSRARALIAATIPGSTPRETLDRLGARALGDRLGRDDIDISPLARAVAQRLPADLGRQLLEASASPTPATPVTPTDEPG